MDRIEVARPKRFRCPRLFAVGEKQIDLDGHSILTGGGERIRLTPIECKLLEYLGARPGRTVTIPELVGLLWAGDLRRGSHSLRTVVRNVRRKLETDPKASRHLLLDRSYGYRLELSGTAQSADRE